MTASEGDNLSQCVEFNLPAAVECYFTMNVNIF